MLLPRLIPLNLEKKIYNLADNAFFGTTDNQQTPLKTGTIRQFGPKYFLVLKN